MDGTATTGGLSLGPAPALPAAGPRCHLRRCLPGTGARHGHPRSSVGTALALAESLCGASDWIDSARMPRSYHRVPGKLVTTNAPFVFRLLSPIQNPSFVGEGLTGATSDSAARTGTRRGGAASRWTASPLRTAGRLRTWALLYI